jgi:hypothetical protein
MALSGASMDRSFFYIVAARGREYSNLDATLSTGVNRTLITLIGRIGADVLVGRSLSQMFQFIPFNCGYNRFIAKTKLQTTPSGGGLDIRRIYFKDSLYKP